MTEPLQVSLKDAAKMLDYSERTVQRMVDHGEIIATGSGRLRRYDVQSIIDKQARMRQGEPLLCARRKPVPTAKVSARIRIDAADGSEASKSPTNRDGTKRKLLLLPKQQKSGAES